MMRNGIKRALVLALTVVHVKGHLVWDNPDFQPVQGLYVKPSSDGTTGDLYVAATEENGVQSQWLTEQPINFLPAASQPQPSALPLFGSSLTGNALTHDESLIPTKRAVLPDATAKYGYGLPSATLEATHSYSPFVYAQSTKTESLTTEAPQAPQGAAQSPAMVPQYSPYHYMYPHMMHAAYASAMKVFKDTRAGNEDSSNANALAAYPTAMWPTSSYYPMQYVMMDPTAWARSQAAAISAASAPATTPDPASTEKAETPENTKSE